MTKPGLIITGATGFLGGRLIRSCCHNYTIYAIARRSHELRGAPEGPDINYFCADVGDFEALRQVFNRVQEMGGAKLLLHMAGYYDFTGEDNPEYLHTNVIGTRNVLELATSLKLKRLLFTSSIAACPFPPPGGSVTENTAPTAPPPYSQSKARGEEMLREYRDRVPSCILRLAAIFSNWCEYEPLFNFLETWFSGGWNARILGGRGQWAIPYLHVRDLLPFLLHAIEMSDQLEPLEVLQASPNGCTTHLDLFREATRCYYGVARRPVYIPKPVARFGIAARVGAGRMTGKMPFERAWMGEYIDQQLNIDASYTHRRLGWQPTPELEVLKCISDMVYNRHANPAEWQLRFERSRKKPYRESGPA